MQRVLYAQARTKGQLVRAALINLCTAESLHYASARRDLTRLPLDREHHRSSPPPCTAHSHSARTASRVNSTESVLLTAVHSLSSIHQASGENPGSCRISTRLSWHTQARLTSSCSIHLQNHVSPDGSSKRLRWVKEHTTDTHHSEHKRKLNPQRTARQLRPRASKTWQKC